METGIVKWFAHDKGYGFIKPDSGQGDLFVHVSSLPHGATLQEGDVVNYEVVTRKGKTCAVHVQVIS